MEHNIYAPPMAVVADAAPAVPAREFYVVARGKFIALFLATLGAYQIYWAYMHWARYRRFRKQALWPVARSIFQVIFTHGLVRRIDSALREADRRHRWAPEAIATVYVIALVANQVVDRMAANGLGSPITDVLSVAMLLPIGVCMWRIQVAANLASGDAQGQGNRHLTWANWIWIALGGVLWLFGLLGLLMLAGVIAE